MPKAKHKCADCGKFRTYKRSELRGWRKKLYCSFHYESASKLRCTDCPEGHEGWKRSELRQSKSKDYCLEHLPAKAQQWPDCPECGDDDFGLFVWEGSVEKTTITCEKCGFKDLAINRFDALTVKVIASPVGVSE
jgi:uncharacterized Zn finger protein